MNDRDTADLFGDALALLRKLQALPPAADWNQLTVAQTREEVVGLGLTDKEIAELLGTKDRQVRRWTSGDRKMKYEMWFTLRVKSLLNIEAPARIAARINKHQAKPRPKSRRRRRTE